MAEKAGKFDIMENGGDYLSGNLFWGGQNLVFQEAYRTLLDKPDHKKGEDTKW